MKDKTARMTIIGIISIILLVSFYGIAISNKDDVLVISATMLAGLIFVLNIGFIFKNISQINKMKNKLEKREVKRINIHPIELFLIDRIWHHKKTPLGATQLYAGIMYSINRNELVISNGVIKIGDVMIENLPKYSRINIELAFLNDNECKQPDKAKLDRLRKLQLENKGLTIDDVKSNLDENIKNSNLLYGLIADVKEEFFINIEGNMAALFMLLTCVVAASELILSLAFINSGNWAFYASISAAILLIITVTSKYRERVTIQDHKMTDISVVLNYIQKLDSNDDDDSKKISLYALGLLDKKNEIVNIFL